MIIVKNLEDANLEDAYLEDAYLKCANLEDAYLEDANLEDANLEDAYLKGANLEDAYLKGANLKGANLKGANLKGANLEGANLKGATMPDGRTWEDYAADHLAGLCVAPETRAKAIEAWGGHAWENCPMHSAHGVTESINIAMAAWVALYDANLLERPE